ncbi:MAG: hypothetical protein ACM3XM_13650 [Mycobacterium leprae]
MKLISLLPALTLAVALVGCARPDSPKPAAAAAPTAPVELAAPAAKPPQPLVLMGPRVKVTDLASGSPVAGALVWVAGDVNTGLTDAEGRTQLLMPLQPGEQTLVVTPADSIVPYKESRYLITVPANAPAQYREYSLVVSKDRFLTFDHGKEVPTPPFNPAPQRVTTIQVAYVNGWHQKPNSIWNDGEGQAYGTWDPFFVETSAEPDHPYIRTFLLNGGSRWIAVYDCPRPVGLLTITDIDPTGMQVSFTSSTGVSGSFDLVSHRWQFD